MLRRKIIYIRLLPTVYCQITNIRWVLFPITHYAYLNGVNSSCHLKHHKITMIFILFDLFIFFFVFSFELGMGGFPNLPCQIFIDHESTTYLWCTINSHYYDHQFHYYANFSTTTWFIYLFYVIVRSNHIYSGSESHLH